MTAPLFERLTDPQYLEQSLHRTVAGKRRRQDVAWFLFEQERNLATIRQRLLDGSWRPARAAPLRVHDPKPRVIARSPVGDRMVHTAIAELLGPRFLRSASECDFACRKGMGTHRAWLALLRHLRAHRFALHLDIRAYFPSIDIGILRTLVARRVDDARFAAVVDQVLESGRGFFDLPSVRRFARLDADWPPPGQGLPMGAVTSQLFAAHVHLQALDHRIKRLWKIQGYVRYVDDFFLFADSRAQLRAVRAGIGDWLWSERRLRLKHPEARILSCTGHLDGLGVRIARDRIEPLPKTWKRIRRRVRAHVVDGRASAKTLEHSLRSTFGTALVFR